MKHNIIQMTATAGLTVPHLISPMFQYIFDFLDKRSISVIIEKPMHPQRVTVWYGFWYGGIIGPFFFENEQGAAVTVNGERYRVMLNEFLFPKIEEDDMEDIWIQQDGATCHTTHKFGHSIVTRQKILQLGWDVLTHPLYSPDLPPSNYHLFRSLQNSLNDVNFD